MFCTLKWNVKNHSWSTVAFPRKLGVVAVVGQLEERIACGLPQAARQLPAVLQDDLGGDDPQVNGQQLVALHHLALVILTVVSQQLSPGQNDFL